MTDEIQLLIAGLIYNQSVAGTYALIMGEKNGARRFSIMIGEGEAGAIAARLNSVRIARPLPHDLIMNLLALYKSRIVKAVIFDLKDEVFISEIHIRSSEGTLVASARTSDAIALALRADAPIFIRREVLDKLGNMAVKRDDSVLNNPNVSETEIKPEDLTPAQLDLLSEGELDELLAQAVADENYELAADIRDAIKKKKK